MLHHKTHQPTNPTRHRTNTYHDDTWDSTNSNLWPSKLPEFRTESKGVVVDDESGICSPPLWKTSPSMSPKDERDSDYRSLSPKSRTQAIVKGQRELMDMVKNMPETHYELSLKDLVEHHHQQRVDPTEEKRFETKKSGGGSGRRVVVLDKVGSVKRKNGVKIDHGGGFYLKMVFPFTLGSKDKKKKVMMKKKENGNSVNNGSSKVTPKPSSSEKEWWKKSHSGCKESDSSVSSINSRSIKSNSGRSTRSNSSSNSSRHEKMSGSCWYFIKKPKSQTKK